jgi:hypothetical protein
MPIAVVVSPHAQFARARHDENIVGRPAIRLGMSENPSDGLTFDGFRAAAQDDSLSVYGKIGFPDSYRAGLEAAILADIESKLSNLERPGQAVLDIGPGCSPLAETFLEHSLAMGHRVYLADSAEMLGLLPDPAAVTKLPGRFPDDHREFLAVHRGSMDAVLTYSVLQYVFAEANLFDFLDGAVSLLAHGGQLLVGDIPNASMRNRFFAAPAGIDHHRDFTGSSVPPAVEAGVLTPGRIDDGVLLGLVARYRAAGFHAFLLPQAAELPMANRREDLLVVRP